MANNTGDKIPVEIVTTVLDKISDFTRETEVLRSQMPTREAFDALNSKVDRAALTIKVFFGVIGIIVTLSFLGAQFIDWAKSDNDKAPQVSQQVLDDELKAMKEENAKQLEQLQKDILENIKKDILENIKKLNESGNSTSGK